MVVSVQDKQGLHGTNTLIAWNATKECHIHFCQFSAPLSEEYYSWEWLHANSVTANKPPVIGATIFSVSINLTLQLTRSPWLPWCPAWLGVLGWPGAGRTLAWWRRTSPCREPSGTAQIVTITCRVLLGFFRVPKVFLDLGFLRVPLGFLGVVP